MPGLVTTAEQSDIQQAENRIVQELRNRAQQQLSGVNSPGEVHVRDIIPSEDLQSGGDNGWGGNNRVWLQGGLVADTLNEIYEINSNDRMEGKILGIFAVSSAIGSPATTEIVFEDGTGSRFERLVFQEAQTISDGEYALMRNPVVFNEGKDGVIDAWADTGQDDEIIFHGAVAEKAGTTLGTRSQSEPAASGTARRPQS